MVNSAPVGVERDGVGGVGLELERVGARVGSRVDDRERALEDAVVVAGHLGDHVRGVAGADRATRYLDVLQHEGMIPRGGRGRDAEGGWRLVRASTEDGDSGCAETQFTGDTVRHERA